MEKRVAVVTDSTAYLPKEHREQLDIHMIPLSVLFGEDAYEEEATISAEAFYEKMAETEKLPTTSQPPIGQFVELFTRLAEEGYKDIVTVHLSSQISGTFQTAVSAGEMADGIQVHGFDSEISCAPQGYFVTEAAKMARQGAGAEAILARLDEMKATMKAYFMVADLKHLHRGGRLGGGQLVVGQLLKIKPLLHFEEGVIVPFEKIRTEKKALARIIALLEKDLSAGGTYRVTVIHAMKETEANELAQRIRGLSPDADVDISYFGPVIGTHLGEGSLGVSWYKVSE